MKNQDFDREILAEPVVTIEALGEKSKVAIVPREYILPWVIIITLCIIIYRFLQLFFEPGYFWLVVAIVWLCASWSLIAGIQSHDFTDEFYPLPLDNWIDVPQTFIPATDKMFVKSATRKLKSVEELDRVGKPHKYVPFQRNSELHGNMRVSIGGQSFVNFLRCNRKTLEWSASVPFNLVGLHPQLTDSDIINQSKAISDALKDIPKGESICFVFGCRSKFDKRKRQLSELIDEKSPIMGIILESEKLKIEEITKKGLRQEWHHYCLINWSQKNQDLRQNSDPISVFINSVKNLFAKHFRKILGTENSYWKNIYVNLGRDIYSNSFLPWKIRLESKGKLLLSSLDHYSAYELLASRFNNYINRDLEADLPQKINVSDVSGKIKHRVVVTNPHKPKDLLSKLIEGDEGISNCPNHDERRDRLRIRNDLIGILKMVSPPKDVPFGEQIFWVWERMKQQEVRDTDVFVEITPGDLEESRTNLRRLVRQSTYANQYAASKGNVIDVDASELSSEAIEAQKRLRSKAQPLIVSFTIHVYRQNDIELDIACERLVQLFAPAKLVREDKVCWKRWLESLPINNDKILTSTEMFSEARMTNLDTLSVRSLLTLIRPRDIHSSGVEFIYTEGGYPIYIDLVEKCMRGIITGGTGSGKTVMAFAHMKQALYRQDRVCVGFDMSNEGEGTLKPIVELLGDDGAYINLVEQSINILQPPDLRKYNSEIQTRRRKIWLESRKKIITAFAIGSQTRNDVNPDVISSIVTLALEAFITDIDIVRRYNAALENGWKSPQWQQMPVLEDFLFFCTKDKLDLSNFGTQQAEALDLIVTNIKAKLADPNIGECISKPSTVSPNARLQFFGLSGLSDDNNAYVLSLVAQGACLNASLEYEKSLVVIDECPALFAKPGFTELVGMQFSLGRKEGTSVLLIGQNMEAITQCKNSSQIIRNTDFHFIGRISSDGVKHYSQVLDIPIDSLRENAGETFGIDRNLGCSYWLIKHFDRLWTTA